jgi:hypothetical protein
MAGYRREWKTWTEFVQRKCRGGDPDPYLEKQEDRVKVLMVCHLLAERKEAGKREKAATSITAAIRKHFATALLNTEWLNSEAIAVARKACRRTPHENREYMRAGQGRARLPVWLSLLGRLREKLWEGRGFGWEDIDSKMTYVTAMYGFDVAARAGEATSNGGDNPGHTILCGDIIMHLEEAVTDDGVSVNRIRGGSTLMVEKVEIRNVRMLEVCALTHKVGTINTTKMIRRNGEEAEEFLEDLTEFMLRSGAVTGDPLFSRRAVQPGGKLSHKVCRSKMVTDAIKEEVKSQGLSPDLFSFHSLRKGAVTQMKALGVSRDEILARGNYAPLSGMIDSVYNYNSTGTGPLGSLGNHSGRQINREDVCNNMPL